MSRVGEFVICSPSAAGAFGTAGRAGAAFGLPSQTGQFSKGLGFSAWGFRAQVIGSTDLGRRRCNPTNNTPLELQVEFEVQGGSGLQCVSRRL